MEHRRGANRGSGDDAGREPVDGPAGSAVPGPPGEPGVTEPITLTDPDGAVTRVAPWSTWTREQVRAPGGEPTLVTRLEDGQLWFSAGRRRSPWRHEVHVGPAVVSTPRGRFQVTAEPDGGATVACLAGRTRVVAGLRDPIVLEPDQSAAVASDGNTLVVMDRGAPQEDSHMDHVDEPRERPGGEPSDAERSPGAATAAGAGVVGGSSAAGGGGDHADPVGHDDAPARRSGRWIPEVVVVAALLGVLVAAVVVFGRGSSDDQQAAPVPTTAVSTTEPDPTQPDTAPATTAAPTTAPTTAPPATAPTTTATVRPVTAPASADGALDGCARSATGVTATIVVTHRSGGPGRFAVEVGLTGSDGTVVANGSAESGVVQPGGSLAVQVPIAASGPITGGCSLIGVTQT